MAGFKEFMMRGNVVDLAVGVIMGVAFGGVVDSMTKDIITPLIAPLVGQADFSAWKIGDVAIGAFLNAVLAFLIKATVVFFLIVKPFQHLMARFYPQPPAGAPPVTEVQLLTEIRDQLKKNASAAGAR